MTLFRTAETQAEPIADSGVAEKFARISENIGLRLGEALSRAESLGDSDSGARVGLTGIRDTLRPWRDGNLPAYAYSDAERARHENGLVIDTLVRHLAEHVAIDRELHDFAVDARRRLVDELCDIPVAMIDFVNRLMASGIVAHDVRNMSRRRLSAVVAAIREIDAEEALEHVPEDLPASSWTDAQGQGSMVAHDLDGGGPGMGFEGLTDDVVEGAGEVVREASKVVPNDPSDVAAAAVQTPGFPSLDSVDDGRDSSATREASDGGVATRGSVPGDLFDSVPRAVPDASADASPVGGSPAGGVLSEGTVPTADEAGAGGAADAVAASSLAGAGSVRGGLWDVLDLTRTGYRIEEHPISSDEDAAAARMVLPESASMTRLALPRGLEMPFAEGAETEGNGLFAERFLSRYCARSGMSMTERDRRVWLFLLFELATPSPGHQLGRDGFFDGVVMPGPSGSSRVRRLVAVDRDRLGDALDPASLAGPAMHKR